MPYRKPYTPEQKARILECTRAKRAKGWSINRVAKFKKIDIRTMKKWMEEERRKKTCEQPMWKIEVDKNNLWNRIRFMITGDIAFITVHVSCDRCGEFTEQFPRYQKHSCDA